MKCRENANSRIQWGRNSLENDALSCLDVQAVEKQPGSPWENGYCESFNGKLRDEVLDREISYALKEAQMVIERWRAEYNTFSLTAH